MLLVSLRSFAVALSRVLLGALSAGLVGATLIGAQPAAAATDVSGILAGNQTWTAAGSPYRMTGNVTVAAGRTLTVEPGVRVETTDRYGLNVVGKLTAVGTAADPITFALRSGLRFYNGSAGSEVAWATVRDSIDFGISTELDGNSAYAPWPTVHDVEFRNNRFATYMYYPAGATAAITKSRFIDNSYGLMGVGGNLSADRIAVESSRSGENTAAYLSNNPGQTWTITRSNLLREVVPFAVELRGGDPVISVRLRA